MRGTSALTVLLALASLQHAVTSLRIAAFNIRSFGETKMSNATLSSYIVQVSLGGLSLRADLRGRVSQPH